MEPQLILLSIIRDYPALVVLILSLQAIVRIVTAKTDPGKLGNTSQVFITLCCISRTSSSKVRMVVSAQTVCVTIGFQNLTDSTAWITSRGTVDNKTSRIVTIEVSGTRRDSSFLARTRTRLRGLLDVLPLLSRSSPFTILIL